MATVTLEQESNGQFHLKGELNMYTVPQLFADSQTQLTKQSGDVNIDLGGVSRSDSAGLALLLAWLRLAQQQNLTLHFHNLPEQMRQIARVSELDTLLPLSN